MDSQPSDPITEFRGEYFFLSNFFSGPMYIIDAEGWRYRTVEHAYHAAKTSDPTWRARVQAAPTPASAKRAGRQVPLRPDWEAVKLRVMYDYLLQKFQNSELQALLLATGDRELIEGNWWGDTYWGVCNGVGENHLGQLLMAIRKEIRNGQAPL